MEDECDARIFIGGKISGYKGKCPGVLEEFLIATASTHPVYLVGAFGGVTHDIIQALQGMQEESFKKQISL